MKSILLFDDDADDTSRVCSMLRGMYNCLALAIKFNGAQITSPDDEHVREIKNPDCAIFFMCSKATHSCYPNIHWYDRRPEDGGARVVRALLDIKKGEELTVSYLHMEDLLKPVHYRRMHLWRSKEFLCKCIRCNRGTDGMRYSNDDERESDINVDDDTRGGRSYSFPQNSLSGAQESFSLPLAGNVNPISDTCGSEPVP